MSALPISLAKKVMLDWLQTCAAEGKACPSNDAIAGRFQFESISSATRLLQVMEKEGTITVERLHKARVVTIVATGEATARPPQRSRTPVAAAAVSSAAAPPKPRIPAAVVVAQRDDGRPLLEFVNALLLMGLDCWRDDRAIEAGLYTPKAANRVPA